MTVSEEETISGRGSCQLKSLAKQSIVTKKLETWLYSDSAKHVTDRTAVSRGSLLLRLLTLMLVDTGRAYSIHESYSIFHIPRPFLFDPFAAFPLLRPLTISLLIRMSQWQNVKSQQATCM